MDKLVEFLSEPGPVMVVIIIIIVLMASFMYYQSEKTERLAIEKGCEKVFTLGTQVTYWGNCKK